MPEQKKGAGDKPTPQPTQPGAQGGAHVMSEPSVTPMDPDDLPRKMDAIRDVLAMNDIRFIAERRREHRRDIDVSDAAMRIAVGFARFLPPDSPLPSDEFLIDLATKVLDGYDGTTRTPRKVSR